MSLTRLTCETIGDLDEGRARAIINAALSQVYKDIEDRGHDEKPRSLTVTVTFQAQKGLVVMDVQAKVATPAYRTANTAAKLLRNAGTHEPVLCFQEHNAEDPDQGTLSAMDKAECEI